MRESPPPSMTELKDAVYETLDGVMDPCSCAGGDPISVLELGLIESVSIVNGSEIIVDITFTSPTCTYSPHICKEIRTELRELEQVESVSVNQNDDKIWVPGDMSEAQREDRRKAFRKEIEKYDIQPFRNE